MRYEVRHPDWVGYFLLWRDTDAEVWAYVNEVLSRPETVEWPKTGWGISATERATGSPRMTRSARQRPCVAVELCQ